MGLLPLRTILLLFSIYYISSPFQLSDVFSAMPQDEPYYVKEGASGPTLSCSLRPPYSDRSQYEVLWTRYHKGQIRHLSRNDKLHEKEHFELTSDAASGTYDLKIKMVSRSHVEGTYQCSVLDPNTGDQHSTEPASVIALVPPGEPVVSEAPTESVSEGETVSVKCTSSGGSPPPTFTWTFPNGTSAQEKYVNTMTKDGDTESTLHFRVRPEDNGAFVSCAVSNKATEGEAQAAKSNRLNVLFRPRVHVLPVQDLTVEAGQPVQLVCETESNPSPPSYEWKHLSSGERYAASKWPLIAERKMSGEFECKAWNNVGTGSDLLNLNVQYAPEITVKERINPDEGERVEIECMVDANPKAAEVRWAGPDGFISNGPLLVLKSVTREQSGNYTCSATNYLTIYGQSGSQTRTGAAVTFVDVKRRPGKAVITPPAKLSVIVGETIDLTCTAPDPGSPEAQFKWASPSSGGQFGSRDHDKANLIVRDVQLGDNGRYRCRPHNRLGEGEEAVVDVTVIEPAKISRPLATDRVYNAGESAMGLECEAQGYPVPNIQWLKDGQPVDSKRYKIESTIVKTSCSERDFCAQTVTGSLLFTNSIQWADKGNYSCVASNGAGDGSPIEQSWTAVKVVHGPVILNQKFPSEALAAAEIGTTAKIHCLVSARPRPTFTWMYNSAQIEETGRYSFQVNTVYDRPDEYEHILQITDATPSDYGQYLCRATNGKGDKAEVIVNLKETGTPQPPSSLQKLGSTPVSLLVGWRPGFDGGFDQTFVVEYTSLNPFTESVGNEDVATVEVRNATRLDDIKADGSLSTMLSYNLTGLKPLSTYYFRVRASNKKGVSEFSTNIVATTNDVTEDPHMVAPHKIRFDLLKKTIEVEPQAPVDGCALLYVSTGDTYRASGCFPADQAISDLPGGSQYKIRFCSRSNVLRCSVMSPALESSQMVAGYNIWMIATIVGVIFVVIALILLGLICCRTKAPRKEDKKGVSSTILPQFEAKNTIIHGSQADSGVFTLDSARLKAPQQNHAYSSSSEGSAPEAWSPDQYDVHHDAYMHENNTMHILQGVMEDQIEDQSVSEIEEDDGRRVMREIIV